MADTHKSGSKANRHGSARAGKGRRNTVVAATAGAAIGIGSAALVAALLYANRPKEDETPPIIDPRFEPRET